MVDETRTVHRTAEEARGGSTPHIVRWVLGISLLAAILAMSAIWITGAATTDSDPAPVEAASAAPSSN